MFWAILYILGVRYSSEPYQLAPNSRIRHLFQNHGGRVARHPIATILFSTIAFVALCYPVPFLYARPSSDSLSTHHVWSIARPSTAFQTPDIGCKQAWIQGSYMGALEETVLEEAFAVQRALMGDDSSCDTSSIISDDVGNTFSRTNDMFLHTPLLYWNCSLSKVKNDKDILGTVNSNYGWRSPVNITLRWGTVLAGKQFHHDRLIAADALVISFWYKLDSNFTALWDERASKLAASSTSRERWDIHPSDGLVTNHSIFEVFFQPMSAFDVFGICLCYGGIFWYLYHCLRDMHAIRSRLGLFITVVLQVFASVTASFTILAVFKVSISHIPMEFYPVVIMIVGLENMSRLTNAVFKVSPQVFVHQRMALAVGDIGASSTIAVAFDLFLLFLFSHISFPAVKEYCAFAAVAITLDFILHLTFFIAVLSVDVNRLELQDTIDRMNNSSKTVKRNPSVAESSNAYKSFKDFFSQRLSTRIAGTAIMMCFIIGLNYHFLENDSPVETFKFLLELVRGNRQFSRRMSTGSDSGPMNQARTPAAWIRLQDQLTAKELIQTVKPGARRLVAQAYDPVYFVLKGASRAKPQPTSKGILSFLEINLEAIADHLQAFLYTIIVISAIITIILNFLLRHDLPDDDDSISDKDVQFLTSRTLRGIHTLDVVYMVSSKKGVLVSAGLDHRLAIWNVEPRNSYKSELVRPLPGQELWPILVISIDIGGEWVAIASKTNLVSFWNTREKCFVSTILIDFGGRRPLAFFFSTHVGQTRPRLVIVRQDGTLYDVSVTGSTIIQHMICPGVKAIQSKQVRSSLLLQKVVTASEFGKIFVSDKQDGIWHTSELELNESGVSSPITSQYALQFLHSLGLILRTESCTISLIELRTGIILHTFQCGYFKPNGFRAFHGRRKTCLYCGGPSISYFSVVYKEGSSNTLVMHTFSAPSSAGRSICLVNESNPTGKCCGFDKVTEKMHWIENVETWETVNNHVLGIRRRQHSTSTSHKVESGSIRRRQKFSKTVDEEDDEWESWSMASDGEINTYALHDREGHLSRLSTTSLLVSRTGPAVKLGSRSVAIGFGNSIKVLVAGVERYEDSEDEDENTSYVATFARKRAHRKMK